MKLPDPKKPLQVTVSPWEVAFGQKVDADRLIQEDKEWLESRQRLMDARKRDDAKLLAQAEKAKLNAPELKAAPSKLESTLSDIGRGLASSFKEGVPHEIGNLINTLQGKPIVESEYKRQPGVFQEEIERSWPEAIANAVVDPTNLVGMELLSPLAKLAKKAVAPALMVGSAAYAGDAEAGGLQKMLQMMYRGRSSFTPIEERAMFMSPTPRYAEEYAKRRVGQIGGDRMVDSYLVDPFNVERRGHNITPEGGGNMQSIIAYPKAGEAEYVGSRKFAKGGLARFAARLAADSAPARRGVADVVKEKGGNWLSGSVENSLSGLKPGKQPNSDMIWANLPDNIIEELRKASGALQLAQEKYPKEWVAAKAKLQNPMSNWVDKQLTRYVKNDMATPGDPIRALAERGVLHVDPDAIPIRNLVHPSGEETRKLGVSEAAKRWENRSDRAIAFNPASDYQDFGHSNMTREHPWVAKLDPTTPMYRYNTGISTQDLGFDHLIDELSNAINPDSGLPRHLQFPADRLDKVSVPQAVERVAEINKWRAALKAEADQKLANNAATVLHKEYPDKGMKWVELTSNKDVPAEGYNITPVDAKNGRYWKVEGPGFKYPSSANTEAEAIAMTHKPALADALKYEGDTMGHCVGGYCDGVASGRSRIYSLRDAKGQPHVTIEVRPPGKASWIKASADDFLADKGRPHVSLDELEEWAGVGDGDFQHSIVQIKGKGNAKPIDEYLPFVQDFVRSGQWSDVGDLQNSGLTKVGDRFVSDAEEFAKGGLARLASRLAADSAPARRGVAEVVKEKGGNWLTGSVEDSLSGLKSPYVKGYQEAVERYGPETAHHYAARPPVGAGALNNWIDKQLTRYVKNDMATPGDPIRALAERGVLHFEPRGIRDRAPIMDQVVARRLMSGNPATERAVTPLGEQWERYADAAIRPIDISELTAGQRGANQWVEKVPANTQIHQIDYQQLGGPMAGEGLGFNHLIDELSNAINPESGLPRHLQFPADRLDRVSVPQAVERVAEINAWRKALKVEEDLKRANNAATVLHKEYPDKGMKWVELRKGDTLPEGYTVEPNSTYFDKTGFQLRDAKGARYGLPQPSEQEALAQLEALRGRQALEDALKYEGDTMGHCVGGYCDDVASGRSRIYSLRDAKGQPHVTIETAPVKRGYLPEPTDNPDEFISDRIVQIKGKGNAKPIDEYLPFVQDFVRSGQWSDVGDLQNTGLWKNPKTGTFHTVEEAEADPLLQEIYDSRNLNPDGTWNGGRYAHGGSIQAKPVKTVQDIQAIITQLSERQSHA